MSWEAIGLLGCSNSVGVDLWNCARTAFYWQQFAPDSFGVPLACCPDISQYLPTPPPTLPNLWTYVDPVTDAPWWTTDTRPESFGFLGFQALSVTGIDTARTDRRSVQTGVCNRALLHGPLEDDGYTIVVEGVLRGLSCCANRYGLEVLRQELRGCCGDQCTGRTLRMLSCLPSDPEVCGPGFLLPPETTSPWRTFTNVVLKEQPTIVNRTGISCGRCGCSTLTVVRFTLQANPGQYLDEEIILPATNLLGPGDCVVTCEPEQVCPDDMLLIDPNCPPVLLPDPPSSTASCFCQTLLVSRQCFDLSLGERAFPMELEAVVRAGSRPLRNLRLSVWRRIPGLDFDSGAYNPCNRCAGFAISYIPAGAVWQRSSCGGVTVQTVNRTYQATSTLLTPTGSPGSPCIRLPCGDLLVCIEADYTETAPDATIELFVREVEP